MEIDAARTRQGTKSERQQEENMTANNNNNSGISEAKKPRNGDYEEVNPEGYRSKFMFHWNHMCDFEDITTRGPMSHTDIDKPYDATTLPCLEIYSWKVTELRGGLQLPLDVFGFVALRDSLDQKRNFIFNRGRDDPQRLTATDSSLELTGPVRAVQLCMQSRV